MNRPLGATFDQRIADWLEDDPAFAPREVLSTVIAAFPSIEQRPASRAPWRLPTMFTNRLAIAALAIVIILAGGFALSRLTSSNGVGSNPTPSPDETAGAISSPSEAARIIAPSDVGKSIGSGLNAINAFDAPFTFRVSAGWTVAELTPKSVAIQRLSDGTTGVFMVIVDEVYPDPCHTTTGPNPVDPGVSALVAALAAMPDFQLTELADVTIGRARGKTFTFGNTIDVAEAGCTGDMLPLLTYIKDGEAVDAPMFGGETDRFWVLDVAGTTVLIAVTGNKVDAVQPILDSLSFLEEF